MSGKFALIIGNSEYSDPGLAQLTAPGKDVEDFARVLQSKDICNFDDVQILLNQPSTSIIEAIDGFFDQKKPDDMLILYFSGHGVKDENGSLYLAFKNTVRSRLRSTAIKSDYIREAMDQSRSKRQVLILDCCNSGAFPQGTKAATGGVMGMTKAFQGYGRFVLTASDATQYAWEGDKVIGETDNSLFTHFLVKGLEGEADRDGDGNITVDELYDYAYEQVSRVTPKQTPTKSSSKQEGEIVLRQNMRIEDIKPVPLPAAILDSIENPFPDIRLGAVQQLTKLLSGKNLGLARSAKEVLERVAEEDDSRQVTRAAFQALESVRQAERASLIKAEEERSAVEKLEAEQRAKEEFDRLAKQKLEEENIAKEKIETDRLAEEKRLAKEKAESERKAQEETERLAAQKVEKEHVAKAKIETDHPAAQKAGQKTAGRSLSIALGCIGFLFIVVLTFLVIRWLSLPSSETARTEPTLTEPTLAKTKFAVGIVLPYEGEQRWIQDETRFKEAFTAADYDVEILFSQGDSAKEKANVETLITKGVKVLIICPQDGTAAAASANAARAAGVKVISYDRLIRDTDAVDYYVTFDSVAVGEVQAQYLVDKATGSENPLYLYAGAASDNNAFLFFQGAWNVLQPKIADGTFVIKNSSEAVALQGKAELTRDEEAKIIDQVTTDWNFDVAKNLAEANLTSAKPEDKGDVFILAPNDGTARAIADTFVADSDISNYVITGQDAEEASVQYIIDGKQSMTVLKDVRTLVADAIAVAITYLEGGVPEYTTTYNNGKSEIPAKPSVVVTVDKTNVKEVVIDSGYWPASDFTGLK